MIETDDEGKQVEAERDNPEQGNHRDVLADEVGGCQQHHGSAGTQGEPEKLWSRRGRFGFWKWDRKGGGGRMFAPRQRANGSGCEKDEVDGRPEPRLHRESQKPFDNEWIAEQTEQGSEI